MDRILSYLWIRIFISVKIRKTYLKIWTRISRFHRLKRVLLAFICTNRHLYIHRETPASPPGVPARAHNRAVLGIGVVWGVFGSPRAPVAWERAPRAYLVVGGCFVGFKWRFSVKMARWSTPRVPFRGTRGVFWGAREVTRKPKRTVLKLRTRTWALRVPRIHLPAASHAKHSPLFSPEKGTFWRSPPVL